MMIFGNVLKILWEKKKAVNMKNFKFKLETALKVRRHREMQQQQAFAKVARKKQHLENQRDFATDSLHVYAETQTESRLIRPTHFTWLLDKHQQVFRLEQHIKKAEIEVENERKILLHAMTRTKVLENLKTKHKMLFISELEKEEQKEMNEIATNRFARR